VEPQKKQYMNRNNDPQINMKRVQNENTLYTHKLKVKKDDTVSHPHLEPTILRSFSVSVNNPSIALL